MMRLNDRLHHLVIQQLVTCNTAVGELVNAHLIINTTTVIKNQELRRYRKSYKLNHDS